MATTIDDITDFPMFSGRPTYQDSLFRTNAAGNIAADGTNAAHLTVRSDMRNSTTEDPHKVKTNSEAIVSKSVDRGRTWSSPAALALAGDQFARAG